MILISHRGNIDGPNSKLENNPTYIDRALDKGFNVEIDLWVYEKEFFLGHDEPSYLVELQWLIDRGLSLWIHCKSLETMEFIKELEYTNGLKGLNYFWHQEDDITLTSRGIIWAYPGKQPLKYSIAVDPERYNDDTSSAYGVCSDYIKNYN